MIDCKKSPTWEIFIGNLQLAVGTGYDVLRSPISIAPQVFPMVFQLYASVMYIIRSQIQPLQVFGVPLKFLSGSRR